MGSLWTETGVRAGRLRRCPGVRPYGARHDDVLRPRPVPIRVLLPGDQEVVAHLLSRRQTRDGWRYEVGLPAYRNGPGDSVESAEYRVWVCAPDHVLPVDGVSNEMVPTE